jgi:quercetin dioxygenase-like cupin family protein
MAARQEGIEFEVLDARATIRVAATSGETGGSYAIIEQVDQPGRSTPPHANTREDITITPVRGQIEVVLPHGTFSLSPGRSMHIPRGTTHWVRNIGSEPSGTLYTFVPGGFEGFFSEVAALGPAPEAEQVAAIAASYGMEVAPPETGGA